MCYCDFSDYVMACTLFKGNKDLEFRSTNTSVSEVAVCWVEPLSSLNPPASHSKVMCRCRFRGKNVTESVFLSIRPNRTRTRWSLITSTWTWTASFTPAHIRRTSRKTPQLDVKCLTFLLFLLVFDILTSSLLVGKQKQTEVLNFCLWNF